MLIARPETVTQPGLVFDPELDVVDPVMVDMRAYFLRLQAGGEIPAWSGFSPSQVPRSALRYLLVIEVAHGPPIRFRWRLIGSYIVKRLGRDSTGQYFDALYKGPFLDHMSAAPNWVLANRRPLRTIGSGAFAGRDFLASENLFLPFGDSEGGISRIVVASVYELPERQ